MQKILLISFLVIVASCGNKLGNPTKGEKIDFLIEPTTKKNIDFISLTIDKSIPVQRRGFPSAKKGNYSYHEERPYSDSTGHLIKVTQYEYESDTFQSYRYYYFYQNDPIKVSILDSRNGRVDRFGNYYFVKGKLIDSNTYNLKIPPQLLYNEAIDYLNRLKKQ